MLVIERPAARAYGKSSIKKLVNSSVLLEERSCLVLHDHLLIVVLGFLFEVVDASIGMGYGTILTPVLLILGFDPFQVIPSVLVSQLSGDFLIALFHHKFGNVDFSVGSRHFKVAITLSILSLFGSMIAVIVSARLSKLILNLYIGTAFAITGLIVLVTKSREFRFSWIRLLSMGSIAAFNKGISGGGYGPIISSGQILSGVQVRSAIGIVSLAEGITCIAAVSTYLLIRTDIDWTLSILLSIGVVLSTPLAAFIVKKLESGKLKLAVGIATLLLGLTTIYRAL